MIPDCQDEYIRTKEKAVPVDEQRPAKPVESPHHANLDLDEFVIGLDVPKRFL